MPATTFKYKLRKTYPHIAGFVEGATVQESHRREHAATAFVTLDGEDYYPLARSELEPLDADPEAFVCPYSAAFVTVGIVQRRSQQSTGFNSLDLRASGDPLGKPLWCLVKEGEEPRISRDLSELLATVRSGVLRTVCGYVYDLGERRDDLGERILRECRVKILPGGATLGLPGASISCTLQKVDNGALFGSAP